jgi:hypothetical protein
MQQTLRMIFLQKKIRMEGFSPIWCKWIEDYVFAGSVAEKKGK